MKTATERVDEALAVTGGLFGGMAWVGRDACIELIEAAIAEAQCQAHDFLVQNLAEVQRDVDRYRWLRKSSIAPLTWKVGIRFPGGANLHEPKTEADVDSWIDEEMRRFP